MDWLRVLMPLPVATSLAVEHGSLRCYRCILAFMKIVVGLFAIVAIAAVAEAYKNGHWCSTMLAWS